MGAPAVNVYVWYRVAGDAARAREAVTAMMLDVALSTGVAGQLLQRTDDGATWMEVYEAIDDRAGFERRLARAVREHDAAAFAADGRHLECFCASGALR